MTKGGSEGTKGNATNHEEKDERHEWTPFKKAHHRYRRRPDEDENPSRIDDVVRELVDFSDHKDDRIELMGPVSASISPGVEVYHGPVYRLKGFPGFLYAPQALSVNVQEELVRRPTVPSSTASHCRLFLWSNRSAIFRPFLSSMTRANQAYAAVNNYCERPHCTNIDLQPPKANEEHNAEMSMWELWKVENGFDESSSAGTPTKAQQKKTKRTEKRRLYRSFQKLSWATMGYNYDWTARTYHDNDKSPVPADLQNLAKRFAATALLCMQQSARSTATTNFTGSACICNYYNEKSSMGGHRDDSEYAVDKPIVSFSAGRPAVFLLGGPTRDDMPIVPILVRPGDVMLMGGETRLNYHAMARLLPARLSALPAVSGDQNSKRDHWLPGPHVQIRSFAANPVPECELEPLREYLGRHRININLRQVYPDDD